MLNDQKKLKAGLEQFYKDIPDLDPLLPVAVKDFGGLLLQCKTAIAFGKVDGILWVGAINETGMNSYQVTWKHALNLIRTYYDRKPYAKA